MAGLDAMFCADAKPDMAPSPMCGLWISLAVVPGGGSAASGHALKSLPQYLSLLQGEQKGH